MQFWSDGRSQESSQLWLLSSENKYKYARLARALRNKDWRTRPLSSRRWPLRLHHRSRHGEEVDDASIGTRRPPGNPVWIAMCTTPKLKPIR